MILGLSQGLEVLWVIRFGIVPAGRMLLIWQRYAGLGDTQLGNEAVDIRQACARAIPFRDTPLFGLARCWPDTAGPGKGCGMGAPC